MIRHIEHLQLLMQGMRNRRYNSVEELQVEVEKALDDIVQILKAYDRRIQDAETDAQRARRFYP